MGALHGQPGSFGSTAGFVVVDAAVALAVEFGLCAVVFIVVFTCVVVVVEVPVVAGAVVFAAGAGVLLTMVVLPAVVPGAG